MYVYNVITTLCVSKARLPAVVHCCLVNDGGYYNDRVLLNMLE